VDVRPTIKAAITTLLVVGAVVVGTVVLVSPSGAVTARHCRQITVGPGWAPGVKLPDRPRTVTVTAPAGYLIDAYCVKTRTGRNAATKVLVQPLASQVVVDHPKRANVGRYRLHLVPVTVASPGPSTSPGTGGPSTPPDTGAPSTPPGSGPPLSPPAS
jgi:hypothetical protein